MSVEVYERLIKTTWLVSSPKVRGSGGEKEALKTLDRFTTIACDLHCVLHGALSRRS